MFSSSDSDCTSLEYPNMVPRTIKPLYQGTSAASPGKKNSDRPKKYCPHIDGGELIDSSGLVGFRKTLLCKGISENASTQPAITCSKLTIETLEQGVKYVQS